MAAELYRHVVTIEVPTHEFSEIQNVKVPRLRGPYQQDLPIASHVVVAPHQEQARLSNLRQISDQHRRSYEINTGEVTVTWFDEYGNMFTKLTTKGNNAQSPAAYKTDLSPSGFIVWGLQDSRSLVRVLKASDVLRAAHVDTEIVTGIRELAALPINGTILPLPEFKEALVEQVWQKDAKPKERVEPDIPFEQVTRAQILKLKRALRDMTFFTTIRGMQVSERLGDLVEDVDDKQISPVLQNAYRYINAEEKWKSLHDKSYTPRYFSDSSTEDFDFYLNDYLPERIAHNIAGMHKCGLVHGFPHIGNISTIGSFYDLDSVRGEPVGDKPITDLEKKLDMQHMLGYTKDGLGFEFHQKLLTTYIEEMGWFDDVQHIFDVLDLSLMASEKGNDARLMTNLLEVAVQREVTRNTWFLKKMARAIPQMAVELGNLFEDQTVQSTFDKLINEHWESMLINYKEQLSTGDRDRSLLPTSDLIDSAEKQISLCSTWLARAMHTRLQEEIILYYKQQSEGTTASSSDPKEDILFIDDVQAYKFHFYDSLVKRLGLDADVAENMQPIAYLFGEFMTLNSRDYSDYYIEKLREQLGMDFRIDEPLENIMQAYHVQDQNNLIEFLEEENIDDLEERRKTFSDFTSDHRWRYTGFLNNYLDELFPQLFQTEIEQLTTKYGEERTNLIINLMKSTYEDLYGNHLTDEQNEEIEQAAKIRVEELLKQYPQQVQLLQTSLTK